MSYSGVLNLNKPAGMSSRRAVDLVARLARPSKAGHAGTLDPLATGVLVVCLGAATRLSEHIGRMPKRYLGTFLLGRGSPTEDIEGEVTELAEAPIPTREEIAAAAKSFVGRISQRPPAFSALKVRGRRAYELARRGRPPRLPARPVRVHRIEIVAYEYPQLTLDIECGGGTYIRSLGRDLAESLGTAAVMSALRRTAVGEFRVEQSVDPNVLNSSNWTDWLKPPLAAVGRLAQIRLEPDEIARISRGQFIEPRDWSVRYKPAAAQSEVPANDKPSSSRPRRGNSLGSRSVEETAALDSAGRLVAILTGEPSGRMRPLRNMPTE